MIVVCMTILFAMSQRLSAEDYLWPTDASRYLTSSFAEYRSGHFHAGIDIKTWGQEGYAVFAIRDGYISRVRVSPFGYGKVLYHRLDTGELAVYAHLQKFNEYIDQIIKDEQVRIGSYRINKYFDANDIPVRKGDIIGFTGSTGIGYPHLHFEIRDKKNRPTNPLQFGYSIKDRIPPGVSAVSITPLNADSRVNADVRPLILRPAHAARGEYELRETIVLDGDFGFAIDCFDKANDVNNSYAVYQLRFFVDGEQIFSSTYDYFSYDVTGMIELDRDYMLNRRGIGLFQKLYIHRNSRLPFYKPTTEGTGMLRCSIDSMNADGQPVSYGAGFHSFRIEANDYNGNSTTVQGEFWVGETKKAYPKIQKDVNGDYYLMGVFDDDGTEILNPKVFLSRDTGIKWSELAYAGNNIPLKIAPIVDANKGGESVPVLKVFSDDGYGDLNLPNYTVIGVDASNDEDIEFIIEKDFYEDFVRLELKVSEVLQEQPRIFLQQTGGFPSKIDLIQSDVNAYYGVYKLIPGLDGIVDIEVYVTDVAGRELVFWDEFKIATIEPGQGGEVHSEDEMCRLQFPPNSVYNHFYVRMNESLVENGGSYDFVGSSYRIEPKDILLRKSATVHLDYPEGDPQPDKLGVYSRSGRNRWSFIGSRVNTDQHSISTFISGMKDVTLIRDTESPMIRIYSPRKGAVLSTQYPAFKAYVKDDLSGIADERSIIMKLDGKKVIAEYDPERKTVVYTADDPIPSGAHELSVVAVDNCKNMSTVTHTFSIAP